MEGKVNKTLLNGNFSKSKNSFKSRHTSILTLRVKERPTCSLCKEFRVSGGRTEECYGRGSILFAVSLRKSTELTEGEGETSVERQESFLICN